MHAEYSDSPLPSAPRPIGPGRVLAPPTLGTLSKPSSPWWKVLTGCAIGCGVVGLAVAAFLIWGAWRVISPGPQVPTEVVVTPAAVAVVHLAGDERAHGLTRLLGAAMAEHNRRQRQAAARQLPDSLRWLERFDTMQDARSGDAVGMWLPNEATLAVLLAANERRHIALAANFRGLVRPIRAFLTSAMKGKGSDATVHTHAGRDVAVFPNGSALSFAGGTLLWSDSAELVEAALDRAQSGTAAGQPGFLPEGAYERLKAGHVLVAAAHNRGSFLTAALMEAMEAPRYGAVGDEHASTAERSPHPFAALAERLQAATLAVAVPSADRADVTLTGLTRDEGAAEAWRTALTEYLDGLRERIAASGLDLAHELAVDRRDVTLVLHLSGLQHLADEWAKTMAGQVEGAEPGGEVSSTPPPPEAPPR